MTSLYGWLWAPLWRGISGLASWCRNHPGFLAFGWFVLIGAALTFSWVAFILLQLGFSLALLLTIGLRAVLRRLPGLNRPESRWLGRCLVAAALALVALGSLGGLLKGMHVEGKPSAAIGDLTWSIGKWKPAELTAHANLIVVGTWKRHAEAVSGGRLDSSGRTPGYTEATWIVGGFAVVDTFLFVPAYVGLLALIILWGLRQPPDAQDDFTAIRNRAVVVLLAIAVVDWAENALQFSVVLHTWNDFPPLLLLYPLKALTLLKPVLFALALLMAAVAVVKKLVRNLKELREASRPWGDEGRRALSPFVHVRLQVILITAFAAILLLPEQSWDVARRWNPVTGAVAILLTAAYGYSSWEIADRLLALRQLDLARRSVSLRTLVAVGVTLFVIGVGLFYWFTQDPRPFQAWGIAIPGAFLVGVAALSRLLRGRAAPPAGEALRVPGHWRFPWAPYLVLLGLLIGAGGLLLLLLTKLGALAGTLLTAGATIALVAWSLWVPDPSRLSRHSTPSMLKARGAERERTHRLAEVLAAAPLIVLGIAMVRASFGHLFYAPVARVTMGLLTGCGVLIAVAALELSHRLPDGRRRVTIWRGAGYIRVVLVGAAGVILAAIWLDDGIWKVTTFLGPVGILAWFAIVASLLGAALVWLAERIEPPEIFTRVNLARIPVFVVVLLWLAAATKLDSGGYHDVRVAPTKGFSHAPIVESGETVEGAFERWLRTNRLPPLRPESLASEASEVSASRPAAPLVLVAASGGGIRAAYWTALILDCIAEVQPPADPGDPCSSGERVVGFDVSDNIFAASGISGGSLGLASYTAFLMQKASGEPARESWIKERLDEDFLAATLSWELFVELPRAFLRFNPGMDRAEVLERAWERGWEDKGGADLLEKRKLLSVYEEFAHTPLLLLNGTTVREGCRFLASPLNAGTTAASEDCLAVQRFELAGSNLGEARILGATQDLVDFLCEGQDVSLSTAALLSARFPFVSPAGRLPACAFDRVPDGGAQITPVTYVVDGGYIDSSAASTLVELWGALEPTVASFNRTTESCIAPFFVQIDNGYERYEVPSKDERPPELAVPQRAKGAAGGAWLANAKQAAASQFTRPFDQGTHALTQGGWPISDRYAHIYPRAHPGVQAPLGWSLSPAAIEDLDRQSRLDHNERAIKEIRNWQSGTIFCAPRVDSASFSPQGYSLPSSLDLRAGWIVTDQPGFLSLYREEEGRRVSVSFLSLPGPPSSHVSELAAALSWQGAQHIRRSPLVLAPSGQTASGTRLDFDLLGCDVSGVRIVILPSEHIERHACSSAVQGPSRAYLPSLGGDSLSLQLGKGEDGRLLLIELGDRQTIVLMSATDRPGEDAAALLDESESEALDLFAGLSKSGDA